MKSDMSTACKAILSIFYQHGIKINCKRFFFLPLFFQWNYYGDIKVLLWAIFGGGFADGGCLVLFFALILKNLYLYRIQLVCHRIFFNSATS